VETFAGFVAAAVVALGGMVREVLMGGNWGIGMVKVEVEWMC
jgi:hypothetical protein